MLEILLGLSLLAIIAVKVHGTMLTVGESTRRETNEIVIEDRARQVLRQIAYEIMGSNRETLLPDAEAPYSTDDLRYQVNLGIQDGVVVWSDPEKVALEELEAQVYWSQNPDTDRERRVVWTSMVAPYLEGELPNDMDDNGNGLIDEKGLSFVMDRDSVTIRMTLERIDGNGETVTQTVETTVTCRNLMPGA